MKIGLSNYHNDAIRMMRDLFPEDAEVYEFQFTDFDEDELKTCDLLFCTNDMVDSFPLLELPKVLFVPHRRPLSEFDLIVKAQRNNVVGFACYSQTAAETCVQTGVPVFEYRKRYPVTNADHSPVDGANVVALVNCYRKWAARPKCMIKKWFRWVNSYDEFLKVQDRVNKFDVRHYGWDEEAGEQFVDDVEEFKSMRYLLHIKYWGHACNAVAKGLAMGVPIVMDHPTWKLGWYKGYVEDGVNSFVGKSIKEVVHFLNSDSDGQYSKLRRNALKNATQYQFPYPEQDKARMNRFLKDRLSGDAEPRVYSVTE